MKRKTRGKEQIGKGRGGEGRRGFPTIEIFGYATKTVAYICYSIQFKLYAIKYVYALLSIENIFEQ